MVDAAGTIVAINPAAERVFAAAPGALIGHPAELLVPPRHHAEHRIHMARFRDTPQARAMIDATARILAQRLDGHTIPVQIALAPFELGGERMVGVSVRDVTAVRETEMRLLARERQLARTVRLAHLSTWSWNVHTGRFRLSPELRQLLQFDAPTDPAEPTLENSLAFIHPDERAPIMARITAAFGARAGFAFDTRLVRRDGTILHTHCDGEVDEDHLGRRTGVFGVVQELTEREVVVLTRKFRDLESEMAERRLIERALRAERDRAQTYLDVAGVMFIGLDVEGRVQLANTRAAEILGCPVDDIVGSDWFGRFAPGPNGETVRAAFRQIVRGEHPLFAHYENAVRRADGVERLISWQNAIVYDDTHRVVGTLSSGEDITDRRTAELSLRRSMLEVQAVNRELESFAYTVSHDLRTPLRSIQGFSEILLTDHLGALDAEAQRLLGRIAQNAERLNELTEHLLALSRVGRASLKARPIDLAVIAREVVEFIGESRGAARVEWRIPDTLPAHADPDLMRGLLLNLFDNARKFTRDTVDPYLELGRDPTGVYFVSDNGSGFDMAFAERLFVPFQRLHDHSYEGSGVGLATVARVVERHGGRVHAEGRVGKGACFRFTLPDSPGPHTTDSQAGLIV